MKKKETLHIYTRVSTRIQEDDGTSLDTQRDLSVEKAENLEMKYKLWNEGAASSHNEDFANRPVLQELLGQIEGGLVKSLYVFNNDRLSRNRETQHIIRKRLSDNEVRLYTKDGEFDFSNPQDEFVKVLLDEVAKYNNTITSERSRLGKIARVKQGYWYGGPSPYGYKITDKKLAIDNPADLIFGRAPLPVKT